MLDARYDTILAPLSIDVSTGDVITPRAVEFSFNEIFDDSKSALGCCSGNNPVRTISSRYHHEAE